MTTFQWLLANDYIANDYIVNDIFYLYLISYDFFDSTHVCFNKELYYMYGDPHTCR